MPSKEQSSQETRSEESLNGSSPHHENQNNIIQKLYGAVLHNSTVQSGVKLIKAKYVEGRQQIDGIRKIGEGVYFSTTERVKNWAYNVTIYNHLTSLWLVKNLPHQSSKVVSFEEFQESFRILFKEDSEEAQKSLQHFYHIAKDSWTKHKSPTLEEIKKSCLQIVAHTLAKDFEIHVASYPDSLVEFFAELENKKFDILTNEAFDFHIRRKVGHEKVDEVTFHRATDLFYSFAKRFAFLEFPLTYANQDVFLVLKKFAKEKFDVTGEKILTRFDKLADVLIGKLGIKHEEKDEPVNLIDRFHRVVYKFSVISSTAFTRSRDAIQATETYKYADKSIHFDDRYKELAGVAQSVYNLSLNVLTSVQGTVTYTYDKYAKKVVVSLYDVSSSTVKRSHAYLTEKYSVLKDATLKLKDRVLEIELSQENFDKLGKNAKEYFHAIYEELKSLDSKKIKEYASKTYQQALELFQSRAKKQITTEKEPKATESKTPSSLNNL